MKIMKDKLYYWFCPKCGIEETLAQMPTLHDAHLELEKHEEEKHKGKPIGNFGQAWSNDWEDTKDKILGKKI